MPDEDSEPVKRRPDEAPPLEFIRPGETPSPAPAQDRPSAWVTRPEDFERPQAPWATAPRPTTRARSAAAGACLIIAGLLGIVSTFLLVITPFTQEEIDLIQNWTSEDYLANGIAGLFLFYPPPVAIVGGISALQRKNWKLSVACAAVSLLMIGTPFLLGTLLGLLGLVLVLSARPEFAS